MVRCVLLARIQRLLTYILDPPPADTDKSWEIVDLTEPISPSYSPSVRGNISDQEDLPKEKIAGSEMFTIARRTGLGLMTGPKRRKPRAAPNKVTKSTKEKTVQKKPATIPKKVNSKAGETFENCKPSMVLDKISGPKKKRKFRGGVLPNIEPDNEVPTYDLRPKGEMTSTSREFVSMKAKVVQALKDVREYLYQKDPCVKVAAKATKIAAAEQKRLKNIKIAKEKLDRATERANRVNASLRLLVREAGVAGNDLLKASEQLRRASELQV